MILATNIQLSMKKTYLHLLYQHNKFLFGGIVFFILGQVFFSYKQVETTPFFNYGMYSEPCLERELYTSISVYNQQNQRLALENFNKPASFLQYQLNYYAKLLAQDSIDLVQHTIVSRFGEGTSLSQYLTANLTNAPKTLLLFPSHFEGWVQQSNLIFCRENFKWVNNNFELVNKNIIN